MIGFQGSTGWLRAVPGAVLVATLAGIAAAVGPATTNPTDRRPDAVVDLMTTDGVGLVRGQWRYSDARLVAVDHRSPGPDLKASGPPNKTYDLLPRAGAAGFDDSAWEILRPETLTARRGSGKLSFNWYRIGLTIPERFGRIDPNGATIVFEIVVDDYAEIWVDGDLPLVQGQTGGPVFAGYNAPNRVVLSRDARPGQRFQIAVLGANGPLSSPPDNFIWVRSATLDVYRPERALVGEPVALQVERLDPSLDALVPRNVRLERLATGFTFTEGPVWHPAGYLLFSDPNDDRIYRWSPEGTLAVFRTKSGYGGLDIGEYGQPGSNGLALDARGRLTICEHGNRRVTRIEPNGTQTILAATYEGRRLNSPNDLVYRSDGSLYFTDPPFGLPRYHDDPGRELPWTGVYRWSEQGLQLLVRELAGPNGLAFSPDERFLYVTNWDLQKKVVMRYPVHADGTVGAGDVFFDMTAAPGEEALDGIKVDREGHLYVSGPGGLWVLSPHGRHLGTLRGPELPANFAWGSEDFRTLYLTARSGLYRMQLGLAGAGSTVAQARHP